MPIQPDTKSWTWVLDRACPECGFDASRIDFRSIPALILDNASKWPGALDVADPRSRPDDSTWSPLEYAAHVRDVFTTFHGRLTLMLTEDGPDFANWDQDATAVADAYNEQDPAIVLDELHSAGGALADAFGAVPDTALNRTGHRGDGSEFTVETLALYFIHDPVHHLVDVTGVRPTSS